MVGLLQWREAGRRPLPIRIREASVLHTRFLRAELPRGPRTPETVLRRRVRQAGKRLLRNGAERVVLPTDVPKAWLPEGLRPVGTLPLRRALAADWCGALLRLRGADVRDARVLVTANALSGEVVRTVTELALRHRYLLLEVPYGGEELCRRLRREYGVSVLLHPADGETAAIQLAFDPAERRGDTLLPLYDEGFPMPALLLSPETEMRLPEGADRAQLLSVLWEHGALRPGQLSVQLKTTENTAKSD